MNGVGCAIEQAGRAEALKRVFRRDVLLFLLGIFYSGGVTYAWPNIRLMGVLNRIAEGRAFRYCPRQTQEEFNRAALEHDIRQLLGSTAESAAPISFLVDAVTEHDRALIDELQRAVERKRRELRKREKH